MKLITWNCNMAFRKKAALILEYRPDILIIPECECREKLLFDQGLIQPNDFIWNGGNRSKGLAVFSFGDYKLELLECYNPDFRNILPIMVTGGAIDFLLFAIWANNPTDKEGAYITQVWKAIKYYSALFESDRLILMGDFNSNTIWDKPRREGNHSTVVATLEENNIFSTYHKFFSQIQGQEEHPTLFMYRHYDKPYHIDYCFASQYFIDRLKKVEIGTYEQWSSSSDHCPLIVEFNQVIRNNLSPQ